MHTSSPCLVLPLHLHLPCVSYIHFYTCIFLQAHHDYCHAADIPQAASDAFHEYVGTCSECHVLRDRLADHLPRTMALAAVATLTPP